MPFAVGNRGCVLASFVLGHRDQHLVVFTANPFLLKGSFHTNVGLQAACNRLV